MKHDAISSGKRKPVNLSLDSGVVEAARDAGLNLSRIAELALRDETKREQERQWRANNREWVEAFGDWYEANGDPLAHLAPV